MAPMSSKKKAKYTYAERVLGALSDIQKEQRKHAVHIATLRAHVRKMADANKDKMGPQWSQWVTRTVQRLADNGVLDTSDAQVTFTPNAKKTISSIRRDSLGPGVSASAHLEHKIWKDVTRRFSTVGVKRQRRRSFVVDTSDNEDEEGRPRKRRARKSFSGLTKAELEAELRAALRRLEEAEETEPVDEDTAAALREELHDRELEVIELRDEISRLKAERPHEGSAAGTSRLPTPPLTYPMDASPARTRRPVTTSRIATDVHGVTRTASGTLISNFTRHPTPEPSDSGSQDAGMDDMVFDHIQDTLSVTGSAVEDEDVFADSQRLGGLEMPQSSNYSSERGTSKEHSEEIAALKKELQAHLTELSQLRDKHEGIVEERESLRATITSRDHEVVKLDNDLQSRTRVLAERESRLAELVETLAAERAASQDAQVALRTSHAALQTEQGRYRALETANLTLQEELSSTCDALDALKHEMESSESARDLARSELEETRTTLAFTQHELAEATRAVEAGATSQVTLSALAKGLEVDLEQSQARVFTLAASKTDLETTITTLQDMVGQLRADLARAEHRFAEAEAEVKRSQDVIDDLQASRAQIQSDVDALVREATSLRATVSDLEHTVDDLRSQLEDATADIARLRELLQTEQNARESVVSELVTTKEARDDLISKLADKTEELTTVSKEVDEVRQAMDDMRAKLETLKEARDEAAVAHVTEVSALEIRLQAARVEGADLRVQLDGLRSEASALSAGLELATADNQNLSKALADEKARAVQLEEDLAMARGDLEDAEEEVVELRAAKSVDEVSIQTLKGGLARLRQLQMDALDEVDSKMISAHTAPTPGHRRRSSIAPRARESVAQLM